MKTITYLAVIEPNGKGQYGVYFPDLPGCASFGNNYEEAFKNAHEALNLHYYGMKEDGEAIPDPTDVSTWSKEDIEGNIIAPITINPSLFKKQMESKRVKINCTIPLWLKNAGEEAGINFSRLLEKAAEEELQM
ncbi:MAG: type II toxin-antitoxin system HicB family antitoxin [Firmicutes bacterium]|nr:type II toxin-antitoxin system HicB family antitoxin [Bacillota bacterium]